MSNSVGDSNNDANFPPKLLLTNTKISKTYKAFTNGSTANVKFSKTQWSKISQLGGFLDKLFRPLWKTDLPLMKNVLTPVS